MKSSIERIDIEGLVTIHLKDKTEIQTTRSIGFLVDVNGAGSSQFISQLVIDKYRDEAEPYGVVDSDHPMVRRFVDHIMDVIANPSAGCFDVPARPEAQAAD